jgi:hypothetical protein
MDGSCRSLVGIKIDAGSCGDIDLSGVTCAAIVSWPTSIHEGNGKAAFVIDPSTTDEQAGALGQIFTGQLGGMPWDLLGPTFEVVGMEKAAITIEGSSPKTRVESCDCCRAWAAGAVHTERMQNIAQSAKSRAVRPCLTVVISISTLSAQMDTDLSHDPTRLAALALFTLKGNSSRRKWDTQHRHWV